mmetsp:Transcript_14542/g.45111  ORF Transcript_14542/g.45111 Transcript_14542/m.45111 type:complete len:207 (+) Transcript_14542:418-1038(+)
MSALNVTKTTVSPSGTQKRTPGTTSPPKCDIHFDVPYTQHVSNAHDTAAEKKARPQLSMVKQCSSKKSFKSPWVMPQSSHGPCRVKSNCAKRWCCASNKMIPTIESATDSPSSAEKANSTPSDVSSGIRAPTMISKMNARNTDSTIMSVCAVSLRAFHTSRTPSRRAMFSSCAIVRRCSCRSRRSCSPSPSTPACSSCWPTCSWPS